MSEGKAKKFLKKFKPSEILKEKYGFTVDDSTFCIMPFIHTSTTTNGEFRLCCRSDRLWDVQNISLKDLWNHKKYKTVRNNLSMGVKDSHCSACWKMEEKGIISLRQTHNFERLEEYADVVDTWNSTGIVPWKIPVVEFKLSNLCNLKCRMCWPKDSTPWMQDWDTVSHIYSENEQRYVNSIIDNNNMRSKPVLNLFEAHKDFINDLYEIIDDIKEFEFAGGEPLMDPLHYNMLERIKKPEEVTLKYSTNLSDLEAKKGRNIVEIWKKFKSVRLTISVDGYDELNAYIRHGAVWEDIKNNIAYVKQELGDKLDYIKASTCISALNVEYLVETLDAITEDFGIMWHTSRLQWPSFLHANVLPADRLNAAKAKLVDKLEVMFHDSTITDVSNRRHIEDAINWIDEAIIKNKYDENYSKFVEFNKLLDEKRKETFAGK
jgi:sulfatase maturation enzyme AslB (radical SAM superfamily)